MLRGCGMRGYRRKYSSRNRSIRARGLEPDRGRCARRSPDALAARGPPGVSPLWSGRSAALVHPRLWRSEGDSDGTDRDGPQQHRGPVRRPDPGRCFLLGDRVQPVEHADDEPWQYHIHPVGVLLPHSPGDALRASGRRADRGIAERLVRACGSLCTGPQRDDRDPEHGARSVGAGHGAPTRGVRGVGVSGARGRIRRTRTPHRWERPAHSASPSRRGRP